MTKKKKASEEEEEKKVTYTTVSSTPVKILDNMYAAKDSPPPPPGFPFPPPNLSSKDVQSIDRISRGTARRPARPLVLSLTASFLLLPVCLSVCLSAPYLPSKYGHTGRISSFPSSEFKSSARQLRSLARSLARSFVRRPASEAFEVYPWILQQRRRRERTSVGTDRL